MAELPKDEPLVSLACFYCVGKIGGIKMKILRYTAISTVILFLFCGIAATADKPSKASEPATQQGTTSSQILPKKTPFVPQPGHIESLPSRITVEDVTVIYLGGHCEVRLRLTDPKGAALIGKTVQWCPNAGSESIKTTPPAHCGFPITTGPDGIGYLRTYVHTENLKPGTYPTFAYFEGDATAPSGHGTGKLIVKKAPTQMYHFKCGSSPYTMGKDLSFDGYLVTTAGEGMSPLNGKTIHISLNGSQFGVVQTLPEGGYQPMTSSGGRILLKWTIPVTSSPQGYNFLFRFDGDDYFLTASNNVSCSFTSTPY
jgi:hypothetical protein